MNIIQKRIIVPFAEQVVTITQNTEGQFMRTVVTRYNNGMGGDSIVRRIVTAEAVEELASIHNGEFSLVGFLERR